MWLALWLESRALLVKVKLKVKVKVKGVVRFRSDVGRGLLRNEEQFV